MEEITEMKEAKEIKSTNQPFPSPFAKHEGTLDLGGATVDCYVLDTGDRVISLGATVRALTDTNHSNLAQYLGVSALKPYIDKDVVYNSTIEFYIHGASSNGKGITAETFLDICRAYVTALAKGDLTTTKQQEIAFRCSVLLSACAKTGLIALIDEVTGYQYERAEDALQVKLKAFIADELREWEKTFPDELWEQFGRLTHWQGPLHSRPKWWGKLVLELIYYALDSDIAEYLRTHKPPPRHGMNYHQWLTQDLGLKSLITHIYEVIGIAKTCESISELREKISIHYGNESVQLTLYLPKNRPDKNQHKSKQVTVNK